MASEGISPIPEAGIQPVAFTLQHVHFSDKYLTDEEVEKLPEAAEYSFDLEVARADSLGLGVALTFSVGEDLPYDLVVAYAGHFQMNESVPEDRREEEWREFALKTAPTLIYPYVREIVSNLTSRWYDAAVELPYVPVLDFTDVGIEIPPPADSDAPPS